MAWTPSDGRYGLHDYFGLIQSKEWQYNDITREYSRLTSIVTYVQTAPPTENWNVEDTMVSGRLNVVKGLKPTNPIVSFGRS